jgi:hypothetical protein
VANSATVKGSSMVVLGMPICVNQELVRGRGAKRRGAAKHARFSICEQRAHAATATKIGGERSWIWAAVNLSTITIGAPQ